MALHFYTAQRLETLADRFVQDYSERNTDIFKKDVIVSYSKGVEEWLVKQVTKQHGIMANYKFMPPGTLIREIAKKYNMQINRKFNAKQMSWLLFQLLEESEFCRQFPFVAQYYFENDTKRVQLAKKIATLFLDYDYVRGELLRAWQNKESCSEDELSPLFAKHSKWQKYLWKKLVQQLDEPKILAPVDYKNALFQNFENPSEIPFNSISIFGISIVSEDNLTLFRSLGQWCDIYVYQDLPAEGFDWIKEEANHSFLECTKQAAVELMEAWDTTQKQFICNELKSSDNQKAATLLHQFQMDVQKNKRASRFDLQQEDNSLLICSSYTIVRELEALYNYLLNCFESDMDLKPHEVVVQCPNIEKYEPYIAAVFDNAPAFSDKRGFTNSENKRVVIPYNICSIKSVEKNTILSTIHKLFSLPQHNYPIDQVLDLLEYTSVRNRFEIYDMEKVRYLLNEANIHFGIEGNKENETNLVSWNQGLARLLLGTTMITDEFYNYKGNSLLLCDEEGDNAELILRLKDFSDTIVRLSKEIALKRTLKQWLEFIKERVLVELIVVNSDQSEELSHLQSQIDLALLAFDSEDEVEFSIFESLILQDLKEYTDDKKMMLGGVSFAAINDARSVPYKVVAMLGLNSKEFPREENRVGFDLIKLQPKPCDENVRIHDQYRFLQSVLSARQKLYISYLGRSVKDNSELSPSLLVEELQIVIEKMIGKKDLNTICIQHPLHGFSAEYRKDTPHFYSYLQNEVQGPVLKKSSELDKVVKPEIDIAELIRFCKDPVQFYFNKSLSIYYNNDLEEITAEECMELDALEQWSVKSELIELDDEDKQYYILKKKSKGELPLANLGLREVEQMHLLVEELKQNVSAFRDCHGEATSVAIDCRVGEFSLTGNISQCYENDVLFVNASKVSSQKKYLMQAWIQHLSFIVNETPMTTYFFSSELTGEIPASVYTKEKAAEILSQLIGYYFVGKRECIPFSLRPNWLKAGDTDWKKLTKELNDDAKTNRNKSYKNDYVASAIELGAIDLDDDSQWETVEQLGNLIFSWFATSGFGNA